VILLTRPFFILEQMVDQVGATSLRTTGRANALRARDTVSGVKLSRRRQHKVIVMPLGKFLRVVKPYRPHLG